MPEADPQAIPVRIGVLGTARIAKMSLIGPAKKNSGAAIVAVASRSEKKARRFAAKHRIARGYGGYQSMLDDPDVEVVYNALPNHLHAEWSIRALRAGKHVLCEKPLAANANEARAMQAAAAESGRQLIEAFHYRYHPLAARMREIVSSGSLGAIRDVEAHFCIYYPGWRDIRFAYETAGGALMDVGCYTVNACRFLIGTEPVVKSAKAHLINSDVDHGVSAEMEFPGGITARISASLRTHIWNWRVFAKVTGEKGTLTVLNPFLPQFYYRITVKDEAGRHRETLPQNPSTYACQLDALVAAVRRGAPMPTDGLDGIRNMTVIDSIYSVAGLRSRGEQATG